MLPVWPDEGSKGPERSALGPVRQKTGGFATHACSSPNCKGSSHQTRDPSQAVLCTIASLGLVSKSEVTGTADDEFCTGSQSLLHTNTSGSLLPPLKKQCMLVARIVDQLTEKNPELKRVLTKELADDQGLLDVPSQEIGEDLSELIDKALGERDVHGAVWSGENPRYDCEGIFYNPQGQARFLREQTRFTNSPTVLSPEIRKTDPLKAVDISQSTTDDGIPDYHLPIDSLETPKARQPISEYHHRRNSTRNRSKHVFDLAKTRTISAPCASAEQMYPSYHGRCNSHPHKTQGKAASIEHNLRKYTQGERKPGNDGNDGPDIQHANTHRLSSSMLSERQAIHSEHLNEIPKRWCWWRFILIDKEPSGSQPPVTDTGLADKQALDDGMHVLADFGRDDEYESEKELEQEILRVLIHREQLSEDCSPPGIVGRPEKGTPTVNLCSKENKDGGVKVPASKDVGKTKYRLSVTIDGRSDTKLKVDIRSR